MHVHSMTPPSIKILVGGGYRRSFSDVPGRPNARSELVGLDDVRGKHLTCSRHSLGDGEGRPIRYDAPSVFFRYGCGPGFATDGAWFALPDEHRERAPSRHAYKPRGQVDDENQRHFQ